MRTPVDLANIALGYLGLNPIASLEDDGDRAEAARRNWPVCKDAFLQEYDWSFAKRAALLPRREETPPTWKYAFACPDDFIAAIRVIPPGGRNLRGTEQYEIMLSVEGDNRVVMADLPAIVLEYTSSRASLALYSPLAVEALTHRFAFLISQSLKRNAQEQQTLWQGYQAAARAAMASDAGERGYPKLGGNVFSLARRNGLAGRIAHSIDSWIRG